MSWAFTLIDDTFSANESSGRKRIFGTLSFVNPYTAAGELITSGALYFKTKWLGGKIINVSTAVTSALAGIAQTGTFRGDTSSFASVGLQFFQTGLSGTANAGLWVDNTTANISATTVYVEMNGY
jgi:hypothetical protein